MARGKRPVSFRTRKLSLSAPMVLPWRRGGRVGRRRTTIPEGAPASVLGPLRHARTTSAFGTKSRRDPHRLVVPEAATWPRGSARRCPAVDAPEVGSATRAGFLGRRADVVGQPGVQRPQVAPRRAHLVERAPVVQPVRGLPAPPAARGSPPSGCTPAALWTRCAPHGAT